MIDTSACRCFGDDRGVFIKERSKCGEIMSSEIVDRGSLISLM